MDVMQFEVMEKSLILVFMSGACKTREWMRNFDGVRNLFRGLNAI